MRKKLLLGYDIGSSSIKASLINAATGELIASASSPEQEMKIDSPRNGWAEQHPETWWRHVLHATEIMLRKVSSIHYEISGIGISYQMHGLVMVDTNHEVIYPSIIWCDSRAVEIGSRAFSDLGSEYCLGSCLNSPANFTASKLNWVKDNMPDVYSRIYKVMLPGDYIAMKLTNEITTTVPGLSEGVFWDFNKMNLAEELITYYDIDKSMLAAVVPVFGVQGKLNSIAAGELGLAEGIPVAYRAGDQPNNAYSLNVLNPGEVAATAGTSGVIYGVADRNIYDPESRVNTFAHVNYSDIQPNVGVLLCINGTGIQYSWLKHNILENKYSYEQLNIIASTAEIGANGLLCFPFGNGAERILKNKNIFGSFSGINFNIHGKEHLIRAAQEGIAFSFRYGFDIMKTIGMEFSVIKAGNSNLFQSPIFRQAFVNMLKIRLEIYNTDGSQGAARGAGVGAGLFSQAEAIKGLKMIDSINPLSDEMEKYEAAYINWKNKLNSLLS